MAGVAWDVAPVSQLSSRPLPDVPRPGGSGQLSSCGNLECWKGKAGAPGYLGRIAPGVPSGEAVGSIPGEPFALHLGWSSCWAGEPVPQLVSPTGPGRTGPVQSGLASPLRRRYRSQMVGDGRAKWPAICGGPETPGTQVLLRVTPAGPMAATREPSAPCYERGTRRRCARQTQSHLSVDGAPLTGSTRSREKCSYPPSRRLGVLI